MKNSFLDCHQIQLPRNISYLILRFVIKLHQEHFKCLYFHMHFKAPFRIINASCTSLKSTQQFMPRMWAQYVKCTDPKFSNISTIRLNQSVRHIRNNGSLSVSWHWLISSCFTHDGISRLRWCQPFNVLYLHKDKL